jgi:hypothetical protein
MKETDAGTEVTINWVTHLIPRAVYWPKLRNLQQMWDVAISNLKENDLLTFKDWYWVNDSDITVDTVEYNTSYTPTWNETVGTTYWNNTDETIDIKMPDGITLQVGQEVQLKARNSTGSTILNGRPVYSSGMLGNRPTVALAKWDADATGKVLGLTTQDISNNADGKVTTFWYVRNIDTTGTPFGETWADGDTLWVSKTTAGYLTKTEPAVPHHSDIIWQVVNAHATQGSILVNIRHHNNLEELSDVNWTPLTTTGQFPSWNQSSGYFDFDKNIGDYLKLDQTTPQTTTGTFTFPRVDVSGDLLKFNTAGTDGWIGYGAGGTTYAGIWLKQNTPSFANYDFLADWANTFINAPTSLYFRIGNSTKLRIASTLFEVTGQVVASQGVARYQMFSYFS